MKIFRTTPTPQHDMSTQTIDGLGHAEDTWTQVLRVMNIATVCHRLVNMIVG